MTAVVSIEPALFASLDPPRLAGSRCTSCGTVAFPAQRGCARCAGNETEPVELADRGTLWTYTVQAIEPKPPYHAPADGFQPYGVGYIDLGDVIVEARLAGADVDYEIGMPMQLILLPMWTSDNGATVVSYAFEPAVPHE